MIQFKETAKMLQEMIAQVPSDTKKQYDYSFDLSDRIDKQMKVI